MKIRWGQQNVAIAIDNFDPAAVFTTQERAVPRIQALEDDPSERLHLATGGIEYRRAEGAFGRREGERHFVAAQVGDSAGQTEGDEVGGGLEGSAGEHNPGAV